MRKLTLFLAILFVSVLCSACINNIAIQELNNKAQEYMQKGDFQSAISRLESSVDLDGSVFETRYNLGVAYISAQDFKKAQEQLKEAIKIKPDFADSYYSLAVAQESDALKVLEDTDDENQVEVAVVSDDEYSDLKNISKEDALYMVNLLGEAVNSYNKYLKIKPQEQEREEIFGQGGYLKENATKKAQKNEIAEDEEEKQKSLHIPYIRCLA